MAVTILNGGVGIEYAGTGTGTSTETMDTTSADFLIAACVSFNDSGTGLIDDVIGGNSNTYSQTAVYSGAGGVNISIYYCIPVYKGSGHQVRMTTSGTNYNACLLFALSGIAQTGSYDTSTGTGDSVSSGNITPAESGELLVGVYAMDQNATATPPSGGFVLADSVAFGSGVNPALYVAFDNTYDSVADVGVTWTDTTPSNDVAMIAAFKVASGTIVPVLMNHYCNMQNQ